MNGVLKDYYEALERLKTNKPINVLIGTKITNDAVSLEAGRKKGTIKRSREVFTELIEEIKKYSDKEKAPKEECKALIEKYKTKYKEYRELYEQALNRELMMIDRINELEKRLPENSAANNIKMDKNQ